MRIKKTLTSDHVLVSADGSELTVADLIGKRPPARSFNPERSGSFSGVQATFAAGLLAIEGKGVDIPAFKGEMEVRVQGGAILRMAGRFRKGFGWKEDRVKLALKHMVHARVAGSQVDLWLRASSSATAPLQRISLELFTPEAADELGGWLPAATPRPHASRVLVPVRTESKQMWAVGTGLAVVTLLSAVLILMLLTRGRL